MKKNSGEFSIEDAMRIANSPTGQQLFALLKRTDTAKLNKAMDQAAAGNYDQVKDTISSLMENEDVKALLAQLGGKTDG